MGDWERLSSGGVCSKGGLTFSSVVCPLDWGVLHVAELLGEA